MQIYTDPQLYIQDSSNKYLLRIDSEECKVLLAALKSFNSVKAENSPNTKSLETAIKEIDQALDGKLNISNGSYQSPEGCKSCQD